MTTEQLEKRERLFELLRELADSGLILTAVDLSVYVADEPKAQAILAKYPELDKEAVRWTNHKKRKLIGISASLAYITP